MIKTMVLMGDWFYRQKLQTLLSAVADIHLFRTAEGSFTEIEASGETNPDLLFLDMEMADSTFEQFDLTRACLVATSSEKKHAFRAFEMGATDLLLKPFHAERFEKCIARVRRFLKYHAESMQESIVTTNEVPDLCYTQRRSRFVARSEGKIVFFKPNDISWIKADTNAVRLNIVDGQSYRILQTMQEVERKLDPRLFLRIHRSILVNIEKVRDVQACGHGEFIVTLRDGKELPLGRSYRESIDRLLA